MADASRQSAPARRDARWIEPVGRHADDRGPEAARFRVGEAPGAKPLPASPGRWRRRVRRSRRWRPCRRSRQPTWRPSSSRGARLTRAVTSSRSARSSTKWSTGRPAFQEKTLALLIAAVQTVDPEPVSKAQPMAPPALDYLVRRCLNKDPRQRLQTALDLTSELQWIAEGGSQVGIPAPVAARRQRRDRAVWAALAVMSVLAVGLMPSMLSSSGSVPEPEAVRFPAASLPTGMPHPLRSRPTGAGWSRAPAVSEVQGVIALALDSVTAQRLIQGTTSRSRSGRRTAAPLRSSRTGS